MQKKIVNDFYHGFCDEKESGKIFRFSVASEEEFVRTVNSLLDGYCYAFSQAMGYDGRSFNYLLWRPETEEKIQRAIERSLFPSYQEFKPFLDCLILMAEIRPMMVSLLNIHHYDFLVLMLVITQRYRKIYGLEHLIRAAEKYVYRKKLLPEMLAKVCYYGIDNEEICRWIMEHWCYCKPYRGEIQKRISHKSGGDQDTFNVFYQFVRKRRFNW